MALVVAAFAGLLEDAIGRHDATTALQVPALLVTPFWLAIAINWHGVTDRFAALARAGAVLDVTRARNRRAAELIVAPYERAGLLRLMGVVLAFVGVDIGVSALVRLAG